LCLDGGSSSAMYYRGQMVRRPTRALTNIIELRMQQLNKTTVFVDSRSNHVIARATQTEPAERPVLRRFGKYADLAYRFDDQFCTIARDELRLSKGRGSIFPVHGTKLAGLKSLKYAKNLVNVASDAKIVNHLVS